MPSQMFGKPCPLLHAVPVLIRPSMISRKPLVACTLCLPSLLLLSRSSRKPLQVDCTVPVLAYLSLYKPRGRPHHLNSVVHCASQCILRIACEASSYSPCVHGSVATCGNAGYPLDACACRSGVRGRGEGAVSQRNLTPPVNGSRVQPKRGGLLPEGRGHFPRSAP